MALRSIGVGFGVLNIVAANQNGIVRWISLKIVLLRLKLWLRHCFTIVYRAPFAKRVMALGEAT